MRENNEVRKLISKLYYAEDTITLINEVHMKKARLTIKLDNVNNRIEQLEKITFGTISNMELFQINALVKKIEHLKSYKMKLEHEIALLEIEEMEYNIDLESLILEESFGY